MRKILLAMGVLILINKFPIQSRIDSLILNAMCIPISNWSYKHPFKMDTEMTAYKGTWDSSKTLVENRSALVTRFLNDCCYFGEQIVRFGDEFETIIGEPIERFTEVLRTISENPIGCKLMRILIAKCCERIDRKLYFVKPLKEKNRSSFINCGHYNFMLLSKVLMSRNCHSVRYQSGKFIHYDDTEIPMDCALFHEMLHWLHSIDSEFCDEKKIAITARISQTLCNPPIEKSKIPDGLCQDDVTNMFLQYILKNDEEYRTMFGIIKNPSSDLALDSLSEAIYTCSKYGWIRVSHIYKLAQIQCYHGDDTRKIISSLVSNFGDKEVWEHYLTGKTKIPKFGVGQYECLDLDSKTGLSK